MVEGGNRRHAHRISPPVSVGTQTFNVLFLYKTPGLRLPFLMVRLLIGVAIYRIEWIRKLLCMCVRVLVPTLQRACPLLLMSLPVPFPPAVSTFSLAVARGVTAMTRFPSLETNSSHRSLWTNLGVRWEDRLVHATLLLGGPYMSLAADRVLTKTSE